MQPPEQCHLLHFVIEQLSNVNGGTNENIILIGVLVLKHLTVLTRP